MAEEDEEAGKAFRKAQQKVIVFNLGFKPSPMPQFILLIRENLDRYPMPQEQLKGIVNAHVQWARDLSAKGIFKDGNGIKSDGRLIELMNGDLIVQPVRDRHEGVGGYYIIEADDLDAAVEIAKTCPTYKDGDLVEVRELGA